MIMWSKVAFLWDDRIRISGPRSLGSWRIKRTDESLSRVDSSVHLIYHEPSDHESLILIRIIPKERTLSLLDIVFLLSLPFGSFQNSVDSPNTLFTLLTTTYLSKLRTSRFFIVSIVLLFLLQFDLVCRVSALSVLNKAIMFLGYMIGVLLGGFLSDKFGRKPVVYYLSVLCNILALAASFVQVYWLYICLRCVVGLTIGKLSDSDWW